MFLTSLYLHIASEHFVLNLVICCSWYRWTIIFIIQLNLLFKNSTNISTSVLFSKQNKQSHTYTTIAQTHTDYTPLNLNVVQTIPNVDNIKMQIKTIAWWETYKLGKSNRHWTDIIMCGLNWNLQPETKGFVTVIQDHVIHTKTAEYTD